MEEIRGQLVSLKDLSEKIAWAERRRQQLKIINKTISLVDKLDVLGPLGNGFDVSRKGRYLLVVKHMKLLTELRLLYRTDEVQSPINCIKREMELVNRLYSGIMQTYQRIINEFSAGNGKI